MGRKNFPRPRNNLERPPLCPVDLAQSSLSHFILCFSSFPPSLPLGTKQWHAALKDALEEHPEVFSCTDSSAETYRLVPKPSQAQLTFAAQSSHEDRVTSSYPLAPEPHRRSGAASSSHLLFSPLDQSITSVRIKTSLSI